MTTAEIITATIGVLALVISLINFRSAARDRRHSYQMQFVAKRNTARGKVNQVQNDATSRGQQLLGASGEISAVLERAATRGLPEMREKASELRNVVLQLYRDYQQVDQELVAALRTLQEELDEMEMERASGEAMAPMEEVLGVIEKYEGLSENQNDLIKEVVSRFREARDRLSEAVDHGIEAGDSLDEAIEELREMMDVGGRSNR